MRSSGTIVAVARGAARRRRAARGRRARRHRFLHIACLPGQTECVRRFCTSEHVEPAVAGARLVLGRRDAAAARSGGRLRGRLSRAARQVRTELASDFAVFYWLVRLTPCSLPLSLLYLLCCCLLDSGADLAAARNARGETALHGVAFEFKHEAACAAFLLQRGAKGCGEQQPGSGSGSGGSRQQRCQKCALSRKLLERRLQRERAAEAKMARELVLSSSSSRSSSSAAKAAADWSDWSSQAAGGAAGETVARAHRCWI